MTAGRRRPDRVARLAVIGMLSAGCTLAPGPAVGTASPESELPPPGFGTLRQDEVSMALASGDLQIMVTPLDESVTRVTAR